MKRWLLASALALPGCKEAPPPAPAQVDAAAPAELSEAQHAALRKAWRESVRYRSAHRALARNHESLKADLAKANRLLETTEALKRIPVVSDPVADAEAVKKMLEAYVELLRAKGTVEVETRPAAAPPPARISMAEGLEYTEGQIAGRHEVTVRLARGLARGPAFVKGLRMLDRYLEVEKLDWDGSVAVLHGELLFFRDLTPVTFFRPPVDPQAIIREAAGRPHAELDAEGRRSADKLLASYAEVDALQPELEASLKVQARLKIATRRFRAFSEHVERFRAQSWSALVSGKKKKAGGDHGH